MHYNVICIQEQLKQNTNKSEIDVLKGESSLQSVLTFVDSCRSKTGSCLRMHKDIYSRTLMISIIYHFAPTSNNQVNSYKLYLDNHRGDEIFHQCAELVQPRFFFIHQTSMPVVKSSNGLSLMYKLRLNNTIYQFFKCHYYIVIILRFYIGMHPNLDFL